MVSFGAPDFSVGKGILGVLSNDEPSSPIAGRFYMMLICLLN